MSKLVLIDRLSQVIHTIKQLFTDNIISENWRNSEHLNDNYHASPDNKLLAQFNATHCLPKTLLV